MSNNAEQRNVDANAVQSAKIANILARLDAPSARQGMHLACQIGIIYTYRVRFLASSSDVGGVDREEPRFLEGS